MTTYHFASAAAGGALIGFAAVLLMLTAGRIAGVSGFASRLLPPYEDGDFFIRLAFVAGIIAAPALFGLVSGEQVDFAVTSNTPLLLAAGFLVGIGAVVGGGCTSGHGVCGTARLSLRSLVATPVFVATAMITVFIIKHVVGG